MMSPCFTGGPRRTRNSVQQATGAREAHELAVGLGAAGQDELAAMRAPHWCRSPPRGNGFSDLVSPTCSAARLSADSCGMRYPDSDPQRGGGDQTDCGNAARFHDGFSSLTSVSGARPRSRWRVMSMKREHGVGSEVRIERAAPPDAVGDNHQHIDRALDVGIPGDVALLSALC